MANTSSSNLQIKKQEGISLEKDTGEFQTLKTALISSAHMLNDTYSSFVSPMLPYLIESFGLLKVEASLYPFIYQGASIMQPIIGHWADRIDLRKIALIAPATTGFFISLLGIAPNLQLGLLLCLFGGISSSIMHAILPALIGSYSGKNLGKGMSFWMVAGDLGTFFGPIVITTVVTTTSLKSTPWLMAGGILISILLTSLLKDEPYHVVNNNQHKPLPAKKLVTVMLPLTGVIIMPSLMRAATSVYLPVYMLEHGAGAWLAGASLSIMQGFGVLGIIIGGLLKDHYGFKPAFLVSIVISFLSSLAFVYTTSWQQILSLCFFGIGTMMMMPVALAIVQEHFPENRSLANGIYLAILFADNAIMGVVAGFMYDQIGGNNTFLIGGLLSILAFPIVFLIPNTEKSSTI